MLLSDALCESHSLVNWLLPAPGDVSETGGLLADSGDCKEVEVDVIEDCGVINPPICNDDGYMDSELVDDSGFEDEDGLRNESNVPALDFLLICGRASCC